MVNSKKSNKDKTLTIYYKTWLLLNDLDNFYIHSGKGKSMKEIAHIAIEELAKKVGVKTHDGNGKNNKQ